MDHVSESKYSLVRGSMETSTLPGTEPDIETENLLPTQSDERTPRSIRRYFILTAINCLILVTSLICLTISVGPSHQSTILNPDLRRTSSWSPIHDMVDLQPRVATINGTLFPPRSPSIARQQPNDEADELWWEYELLRVMPVTKETIVKLGKDPDTAVKLEDQIWGLGDNAYGAVFDVYHQLHCLNSLRKIAYGNHYNVSQGRADTLKLREMHINHCADILFQAIQCSGNVNLMTLHWVETQDLPWPDMSINRQCIDFDGLTEFRKQVSLDMDKYKKVMSKPKGVTQLPAPDRYYELFGEENPNHLSGGDQDDDHIL
ncbi:putative Tat pathway signal sequence [Seiridium cardinale]|uniref:Tat pathway signal sequence n=1 Tax=Seiridium cardinale TaxID=138064 RepID=A0ABR2Y1F3_9PEZI